MERSRWTEEELVEQAKRFCAYVDTTINTIGVYATIEDAKTAEDCYAIKRLKKKYNYKIQMLIK